MRKTRTAQHETALASINTNIGELKREYNKAVDRGEAKGKKFRMRRDRTPHLQETHEEHEGGAAPSCDGGRFPFAEYGAVLREMRGVIIDRDAKGRNAHTSFYDGFPHGLFDVTFELSRRVGRVLGAERLPLTPTGVEVMRSDLIDLANYAVFAVLMLDREHNQ